MTMRTGLNRFLLATSIGFQSMVRCAPLVAVGMALTSSSVHAGEYAPMDKTKALDELKTMIGAAATSGQKVEIWITVFGTNQKTDLVKADSKSLTVKVQGNPMDQAWDKIAPDQLAGVGKACVLSDGKRALVLADYCIAYGFRDKADEALSVAAQFNSGLGAELTNRVKYLQDNGKNLKADDAAYRNGDAPVGAAPATRVASSGKVEAIEPANMSGFPTKNEIDTFIAAKLQENSVSPSRTCTDEEYIRRVYLDLLGIIPSTFAVKNFLRDGSAKKREALVDSLLNNDRYGAHWASVWGDLLREHSQTQNGEGSYYGSYRNWLKKALNENIPYDKFMTELVTASGRADQNGAVNFYLRDENNRVETVNTISHAFMGTRMACAQCHDHPFDKWEQRDFYRVMSFVEPRVKVETDHLATVVKLKNANVPADIKGKIAPFIEKAEAELKIRDAEYYEALAEAKKAKDGKESTSTAAKDTKEAPKVAKAMPKKMGGGVYSGGYFKEMESLIEKELGKDRAEAFRNLYGNNRANVVREENNGEYNLSNELARGQGGQIESAFPWDPTKKANKSAPRRAELARFIAESPLFAKVQANRLWASIFGRGIVDPVDDFRPKNPASHPELLDFLGKYLVDNGFDNKKLLKLILTSSTYERSSIPTKNNASDVTLFSHRVLRRMSAEQINDSILVSSGQAPLTIGLEKLSGSSTAAMGMGMGGMGSGMADGKGMKKGGMDEMMGDAAEADVKWAFDQPTPARLGSFMNTFNQPSREEFVGTRDMSVTITQALELFNGKTINDTVRFKSNKFIQKLLESKLSTAEVVQEIYLNTLSRLPNSSEMSYAAGYVGQNNRTKLEDLHWALMNTREFMFIK